MKKVISILLAVIFFVMIFSGCTENKISKSDEKIDVVCTIAPVYDFVSFIAGEKIDKFNIRLLSGNGDVHGFQPSLKDALDIQSCDILIAVGTSLDSWTEKLEGTQNVNIFKLFDCLNEEQKLLFDKDHEHSHDGDIHHDFEYDEHIWLSLKLSSIIVDNLSELLCDIDPENGVIYQKNALDYIEKLKALDEKYKSALEESKDKTVIFADRFPFGYLMRDYGITCYSAFKGCVSDADASFETVIKLAENARKFKKKTVLVLENSDHAILKAIKGAAEEQEIDFAVMDSCQTVMEKDAKNFDYIKTMEENLNSLKKALL